MLVAENKTENKVKESAYFQALDFFMLRSPLLPLEFYMNTFNLNIDNYEGQKVEMIDRLIDLSQNPYIRESIAVSSLSLLKSLPNLANDNNNKKKDQAIKGFIRYFIRMISRPTPYGLCSGVSYGIIGDSTQLSVKGISNHQKKSRPDMEWVLKLIKSVETNSDIVHQLHITTNSMVYFTGSRAKLPYVNRYGEIAGAKGIEHSSIRVTPVVELVLEQAKSPILYTQLLKKVQEAYPTTDVSKINQFLMQLFQQEFLISNLKPPITIGDPFSYVINQLRKLNGLDHLLEQLNEVQNKLHHYNCMPIGQGEKSYKELVATMNKVMKVKNPVQVDMKIATDDIILPVHLQGEVSKVTEILWRLSPDKRSFTHLETYKDKFLDKYGTTREVPILKLLDEDMGLGAPPTYKSPMSRMRAESQGSNISTKRESLLMEWVLKAQKNKLLEIEITDDMIQDLEPIPPNINHTPSSLELYFTLASSSKEEIDKGNYDIILSQNSGSNGGGKTFGRFTNMLGNEIYNKLEHIHEIESSYQAEDIFAELAYLPASGRATNVAITPSVRPYEITFGTNSSKGEENTIPLNDILVGITMEDGNYSFYLRSKRLGKKIVPKSGHMLNMMMGPNVYRFLRELGNENERRWESFSWGTLDSSPFLPRLRYGKAILSLARWKMSPHSLSSDKSLSHEIWFNHLQSWKTEWEVPRYVYLTEGDNRLLLDLENPLTVLELRRDFEKLKEGQHLLLTEAGFDLSDSPLEGNQGNFMMECVFPVVRKQLQTDFSNDDIKQTDQLSNERNKENASNIIEEKSNVTSELETVHRTYLPGGEWVFLKLYGLSSRIDEFIVWHMKTLTEKVAANQWADQWFFMRYADPEPHIRLRFKGKPDTLYTKLIPLIHQWGKNLQQEGLLSSMVIDTYDPEVERYGGATLIEVAEKVFEADSVMVTELLRLKRENLISLDLDLIAVICAIDIMECFSLSFKEQLSWFNERFSHKDYLKEFRQKRKNYMDLGNAFSEWEKLRSHSEGRLVYRCLKMRRDIIRQYAEQVYLNQQRGELISQPENIISSVIHMTMNRFGISFNHERKVMCLTRHTLHNLRYLRGIRD
ncbi:lantibiotic dehydratase [Cytobacillus sp. IB215665]|uniref:lantibiotic dehydratase n=1 Tax=Cytobacillus sp. IB215665 TaxID=3097357 RepID=UPI002A183C25|nr:lantibiotic dehydratase [Cytobacillus sp. IB215665]MDX8365445.1 lantibiotic dehydratase [Cytobacillus sp. IB215665]